MLRRLLLIGGMATAGAMAVTAPVSADYHEVQSISATNPTPGAGQPFGITGTGCPAGTVDIMLGNTVVADDVRVNPDGTFSTNVVAPSAPGTYTYSSVCGTTTVRVLSATPAQQGGALPRTGTDSSVSLARVGIAAIAGGGVLVALSRRRRTVTA
jgi:LPXTG-motif cell wall-anchored protein